MNDGKERVDDTRTRASILEAQLSFPGDDRGENRSSHLSVVDFIDLNFFV